MKKSRYEYPVPEHQDDAVVSQANPVSGTKYTLLDTTKNVRIIAVAVKCTWTVQPTPIEIHFTIDGISLTAALTDPATDAWAYAYINPALAGGITLSATSGYGVYRAYLVEGRSIKIEMEITGGTVSNLTGRCVYAKY